MFSERLEGLIQASLQDGVLSDQEKQAILKRAVAEGEDPDEVDIYIQSLLQKNQQLKKKEQEKMDMQHEKQKKEAIGRVCPKCGKQVPPLTLKCECGFEFTTEKKKTSVQELVDKIESIGTEKKGRNKEGRILDAISLFPVPNTKEDIIEFLALSGPNAKKKGGIVGSRIGRLVLFITAVAVIVVLLALFVDLGARTTDGSTTIGALIFSVGGLFVLVGIVAILASDEDEMLKWNKKANVWRAKFDQVLMKGRSLRGDPDFQRQLDYFEKMVK